MSGKVLGVILAILAVIILLIFNYSVTELSTGETALLSVTSEGPIELEQVIKDIESTSYYEGYDNNTLNWMKSLESQSVFMGDGIIVIMSQNDASHLHSEFINDAYIVQDFKCNINENHTLCNLKRHIDVLVVSDVEYLGENITHLQG